jgi:membrane protein
MVPAAAPPPILGDRIDPPPRRVPGIAERLDRWAVGGIGYRAARRFSHANVGLLAAGTAYYLFLAMLSLLTFTYGLIATVGADELATRLTNALTDALPEIVGAEQIDPDQLRATGQAAGVVGLAVLLWSSLGAVTSAAKSMHLVYGAPPDPRTLLRARARHLVVLLGVAPLLLVSFSSAALASTVTGRLLDAIGVQSGPLTGVLASGGLVLGYGVDVLVLWLLLGHLGGIRPGRRSRVVAALVGAVAALIVKQLLSAIVAWSLAKPQYGAFAAPLGIMFVLALMSTVLYGAAALAGAIGDRNIPLDQLGAGESRSAEAQAVER